MTLDEALEELRALARDAGYEDLPTVAQALKTMGTAVIELKARRRYALGDHLFVPTASAGFRCFHCSAPRGVKPTP